jgi:hypothetical protein
MPYAMRSWPACSPSTSSPTPERCRSEDMDNPLTAQHIAR